MASMMAQRSAARSSFFGASSKAARAPVMVAKAPRTQVAAQALFGFGAKKETAAAATSYYICTACGFIYDGDFKTAPASYKCPVCNVPKSKFKVYKGTDVKGRPNNGTAAMKKRFTEKQW